MKIGTRKSRLAMVRTEMAAEAIKTAFPSVPIEIAGFETKGDQQLTGHWPLSAARALLQKS